MCVCGCRWMGKSFPAMAVVMQSAGPARRPVGGLSQSLYKSYPGFVPAHASFENRSLIDFPIGHEHHTAHGAYCFFETRPMIDFQMGNARSRGSFRYLGRRAIFPTQTFRDFPSTNLRRRGRARSAPTRRAVRAIPGWAA